MPFTFTVDDALPLIRIQGIESFTLDDVQEVLDMLAAASITSFPRLFDLRTATIHVSARDVQQAAYLMQFYYAHHELTRTAAVTCDPTTYGLLRMYQLLNWKHDPDFGVFRTLPEAMSWLHLDDSPLSIRS